MIEFNDYEEVNGVYAKIREEDSQENLRKMMVLKTTSTFLPEQVRKYLFQEAQKFQFNQSQNIDAVTEIQKLLSGLPPTHIDALVNQNDEFLESSEIIIYGDTHHFPGDWLQVKYGSISVELEDEEINLNLFDEGDILPEWIMKLRLDDQGFFPEKKMIVYQLKGRTTRSESLIMEPRNYSPFEVINVLYSLYDNIFPPDLNDLKDLAGVHLEKLAEKSLKETLEKIKTKKGLDLFGNQN